MLKAETEVLQSSIGSWAKGMACEGKGGYSDVQAGMEVQLLADGKVVELARFGEGKILTSTNLRLTGSYKVTYECEFRYSLTVPTAHEFYTVKIGRRGESTYRREELAIPGALSHSLGR